MLTHCNNMEGEIRPCNSRDHIELAHRSLQDRAGYEATTAAFWYSPALLRSLPIFLPELSDYYYTTTLMQAPGH